MTETKKPRCKLSGRDSNIFALAARAGAALEKAKQGDKVAEMQRRIYTSSCYEDALRVIADYVAVS